MALFKPSTWFQKKDTTPQTGSPVFKSTETPTGLKPAPAISNVPKVSVGSGGGGGLKPYSGESVASYEAREKSLERADASYTQGTSVYNPATNRLESNKIILPKTNISTPTYPRGGTSMYTPIAKVPYVSNQPYYQEEVVGSFTSKDYKTVPTKQLFIIDPRGKSFPFQGSTGYESTKREATVEESKYYFGQTNVLQASTKTAPGIDTKFVSGITGISGSAFTRGRQLFTEPVFSALESKGITSDKMAEAILGKYPTSGLVPGKLKEFQVGAISGIITDVRERPLQNVALVGLGYGVGLGTTGLIKGASAIGWRTEALTKGGINILGTGLTGAYAFDAGSRILTAPSVKSAGSIFGTSAKDIGLVGFGYAGGSKGGEQLYGLWRTRGRDILNVPQGVFPSAPSSKQLGLFKTNIYSEFGNKPIAFHTTPKSWWGGKITEFKPGTSELPGVYGSTDISISFSGVSGSSRYKLFPSLKDMFQPSGKPGVLGLQPKGFRIAEWFGSGRKPKIVSGERVKEYSFWKTPVRKGYADLPLMKPEKEAIFRPESGEYTLVNKKYYTTISKVRVPIDVFKYSGGKGKPSGFVTDIGGVKIRGGSSSYSLPPSRYSLFTPSSIAIRLGSSSRISKTSRSYLPSSASSLVSSTKSIIGSSRMGSSISRPSSRSSFGYPSSFSSVSKSLSSGSLISSYPKYGSSKPPYIPTLGADFKMTTKIFKGKQPKKYTPSFGVIAGLQKGSSFAGKRLTGLETRGYTKGFTWAYSLPKLKFKGMKL